ncbi:hypothetical protein ACNY9Y_001346 [Cronobacter dublinensis]
MTNKIDTFLSRISHISQFVLVAFAIFGYFYTVRPIYQKEILSEEIAKKEVELNKVKNELKVTKENISFTKKRESELNNMIEALTVQYNAINNELASIKKEADKARLELVKQKEINKEVIYENKKNLTEVYLENLKGILSTSYLPLRLKIYKAFDSDKMISKADYRDFYISPYKALKLAISNGKNNFFNSAENVPDEIKTEILNKINELVEKNRGILDVHPTEIESVYDVNMSKYYSLNDSTDFSDQLKAVEVKGKLFSYISNENLISKDKAMDFLQRISSDMN